MSDRRLHCVESGEQLVYIPLNRGMMINLFKKEREHYGRD